MSGRPLTVLFSKCLGIALVCVCSVLDQHCCWKAIHWFNVAKVFYCQFNLTLEALN